MSTEPSEIAISELGLPTYSDLHARVIKLESDVTSLRKRAADVELLTDVLRGVLEEWQPHRGEYQSARKGDRQYEQARAVWQSAHDTLKLIGI